jgi:hypothetical protein
VRRPDAEFIATGIFALCCGILVAAIIAVILIVLGAVIL